MPNTVNEVPTLKSASTCLERCARLSRGPRPVLARRQELVLVARDVRLQHAKPGVIQIGTLERIEMHGRGGGLLVFRNSIQRLTDSINEIQIPSSETTWKGYPPEFTFTSFSTKLHQNHYTLDKAFPSKTVSKQYPRRRDVGRLPAGANAPRRARAEDLGVGGDTEEILKSLLRPEGPDSVLLEEGVRAHRRAGSCPHQRRRRDKHPRRHTAPVELVAARVVTLELGRLAELQDAGLHLVKEFLEFVPDEGALFELFSAVLGQSACSFSTFQGFELISSLGICTRRL